MQLATILLLAMGQLPGQSIPAPEVAPDIKMHVHERPRAFGKKTNSHVAGLCNSALEPKWLKVLHLQPWGSRSKLLMSSGNLKYHILQCSGRAGET